MEKTELEAPPTGDSCDVCGRAPEDFREETSYPEQQWYRIKYQYTDSHRYELECSRCHDKARERSEKREQDTFDPELV
jgi:hypothetical protein